jgi:hypothetical protein
MKRLVIACLALIAFTLPVAGQPKFGVTVTADKATDFKKFKTYAWQTGWDAVDKKVHGQIVAAFDRELKAVGLELKTTGPADVMVKYAALRRIDMQVSSKADAVRNPVDVASLVFTMSEPGTGKEVLHARLDKPIDIDPAKMEATINQLVAEIFVQYPTRTKK